MNIIRKISLGFALSVSVAFSFASNADENVELSKADNAQFEVQWIAPEKFRDLKHPTQSRSSFRKSVLNKLEEYMSELARERLAEGQRLVMKVTELDLAGTVLPSSYAGLGRNFDEVRVVRQIDIPRMSFTHELIDQSGKVLKAEDVKLKDMSFMDRAGLSLRQDSLKYEKRMIAEWFEDAFEHQSVEKEPDSGKSELEHNKPS